MSKKGIGQLAAEIAEEIEASRAELKALQVKVANLRAIEAELLPKLEKATAEHAKATEFIEFSKRRAREIVSTLDDLERNFPEQAP